MLFCLHLFSFSSVQFNSLSEIVIVLHCLHFVISDDTSCASDKVLTDAHVKVLLLDPKHDKLIVCLSLYQGTCQRKQRGDISSKDELASMEHVVANDADSSTVAFVAPGAYR